MKYTKLAAPALLLAVAGLAGCSKSADTTPAAEEPGVAAAAAGDVHGAGPNGGVVFDLGAQHAEFTVDHDKKELMILVLGDDGATPAAVAAAEFIVTTKETKAEDDTVVPPMTVVASAVDAEDGKASKFVGSDPGIGNVADFAGTVSGEIGGTPVMGEFDEAGGGGHGHAHTPHDGVIATLSGASGESFVELKLHDDKGDLELWLAHDRQMTQPFDLPADTEITVTFKDVPGKTAVLAVRNNEDNEDEDGTANMRNGKTNYFIFPGDSGQDPAWLMGLEFRSAVMVTLTVEGKEYRSEEFLLVPHTHANGHAH
jgi:hypothetical protein